MLLRDARDLLGSVAAPDRRSRALGIAGGLARAVRWLPRYLRRGAPLVARAELRRLGAERWELEAAPAPGDPRSAGAEIGT
jgi:hypothetical protein